MKNILRILFGVLLGLTPLGIVHYGPKVKMRIDYPVGSIWHMNPDVHWFRKNPFSDTLEVTGYDGHYVMYESLSNDPYYIDHKATGLEHPMTLKSRYVRLDKPGHTLFIGNKVTYTNNASIRGIQVIDEP